MTNHLNLIVLFVNLVIVLIEGQTTAITTTSSTKTLSPITNALTSIIQTNMSTSLPTITSTTSTTVANSNSIALAQTITEANTTISLATMSTINIPNHWWLTTANTTNNALSTTMTTSTNLSDNSTISLATMSTTNTSKQWWLTTANTTNNALSTTMTTSKNLSNTISFPTVDNSTESPCQENWTYLERTNKCYYVDALDEDLYYGGCKGCYYINWEYAYNICISINSTLTSIHSDEENDFLVDLAMSKFFNKSLQVNPLFGFWIGLVAYNSTYNWEWTDGTPVNYFNWGSEAPNAYRYQDFFMTRISVLLTPGGETATKLWHSDKRWSDYWTGFYQVGYICIKDSNIIKNISQDYIVVQPNYNYTDVQCEHGWIGFKNYYCYHVIVQNTDYFTADQACRSLNSSLVSIHSLDENNFLLWLLNQQNTSATDFASWIGLQDYSSSMNWAWSDRSDSSGFQSWGPQQPMYPVGFMRIACTILLIKTSDLDFINSQNKWIVSFCDTIRQAYICMKISASAPKNSSLTTMGIITTTTTTAQPTTVMTTQMTTTLDPTVPCVKNETSPCDCGWAYYEPANKCFYPARFINLDWYDAKAVCESLNASLATIHTRDEHYFLYLLSIPDHINYAYIYYSPTEYLAMWIGLIYNNTAHTWEWLDGTPTNYFFWAHYSPGAYLNNPNQITGTVFVIGGAASPNSANNRRWVDDLPTNIWNGILCEKTSSLPTNYSSEYFRYEEAPIFDPNLECEMGWYGFNKTCYYAVVKNLNFSQARSECDALNASMVIVHNMDLNDFLLKIPVAGYNFNVYAFWIGYHSNFSCSKLFENHRESTTILANYTLCPNYLLAIDGTIYDFVYWSTFEPNGQGYRQDIDICVIIVIYGSLPAYRERLAKWSDTACSNTFQGVFCQKDAATKGTYVYDINRVHKIISDTPYVAPTIRLSSNYISTLDQSACFYPPSNAASILVAYDTKHYDLSRTTDPIAICPCEDGNRLYYASSNTSLPSDAYWASELAFNLYYYANKMENMLFDGVHNFCQPNSTDETNCVETRNFCPDMCICDVNLRCYQPFAYNTEVLLVPYCENGECFVYAVPSLGNLCHLCEWFDLSKCVDCVNGNATTDRVGLNSPYLKVDKISCNGCPALVNMNCPSNTIGNSSGIPGWPAMIDINQTNINLIASNTTQVAQYTCGRGNSHYSTNTAACSQFSNQDSTLTNTANWRPYVLHPKILNAEFATDAFKYIVYECSFFYGFSNNSGSDSGAPNFNPQDNLFDASKIEQLETQMEVAILNNRFDLMGGQCSKLNYGRFQALRPEVDKKWRTSIAKFDTLRYINLILAFAFGVGGYVVSLTLLILISRKKELQTGFGAVCFIQVINDVIMFTNVVLLEGASNMKSLVTDRDDPQSYIAIFGWRPDGLMFFIFWATTVGTMFLNLIKSGSRFIALYYPIFFNVHITTNTMRNYSLLTLLVIFIVALPLFLVPTIAHTCNVAFNRAQYIQLDYCTIVYWGIQTYGEYILALICFVIDLMTAFKLYQMRTKANEVNDKNADHKRKLEHLFILQNFGNLATFVILIIPNIIYVWLCNFDRWHCIAGGSNNAINFIYQLSLLMVLYNSRVAIWRCVDEIVTLAFQLRILNSYNKTTKTVKVATISTPGHTK